MVNMIYNAENSKVLGMHIMGPHASDLIAEGVLAIQLGATAGDIAHTIHAHPTLTEAVGETAMGQLEGSIHFRRMWSFTTGYLYLCPLGLNLAATWQALYSLKPYRKSISILYLETTGQFEEKLSVALLKAAPER